MGHELDVLRLDGFWFRPCQMRHRSGPFASPLFQERVLSLSLCRLWDQRWTVFEGLDCKVLYVTSLGLWDIFVEELYHRRLEVFSRGASWAELRAVQNKASLLRLRQRLSENVPFRRDPARVDWLHQLWSVCFLHIGQDRSGLGASWENVRALSRDVLQFEYVLYLLLTLSKLTFLSFLRNSQLPDLLLNSLKVSMLVFLACNSLLART